MKVNKKEENVFSTSALDLFCSAMGVFMLLCFVVMPYYRNQDSAKDASVVTPGLTVALTWSLKDVKLVPLGEGDHRESPEQLAARTRAFCKEYDGYSCDFELVVSEQLPGHEAPILHDFKHIGQDEATKARLVADGAKGGSEVWVQPAVIAGEVCDAYAFCYEGLKCPEAVESYTLVLHVLVLTGNGETQQWELELPYAEHCRYQLTAAEQQLAMAEGYAAKGLPQNKRIPLLRFAVGKDCSITVDPAEGSRLKDVSK